MYSMHRDLIRIAEVGGKGGCRREMEDEGSGMRD
jgi:hypothetical protein